MNVNVLRICSNGAAVISRDIEARPTNCKIIVSTGKSRGSQSGLQQTAHFRRVARDGDAAR
ncbi:hypothetical protein, partial [Burkholderia anthina]|uniref:hypothetical protein n=1 Tax=Burkholderia anthina TaxID=179879 RepID=UPI0033408B24